MAPASTVPLGLDSASIRVLIRCTWAPKDAIEITSDLESEDVGVSQGSIILSYENLSFSFFLCERELI